MTDREETDLRAGQAARLIGIHVTTLGRYARKGQVRFRTLPSGERRYRRSELEADLARTNPQEDTPAGHVRTPAGARFVAAGYCNRPRDHDGPHAMFGPDTITNVTRMCGTPASQGAWQEGGGA